MPATTLPRGALAPSRRGWAGSAMSHTISRGPAPTYRREPAIASADTGPPSCATSGRTELVEPLIRGVPLGVDCRHLTVSRCLHCTLHCGTRHAPAGWMDNAATAIALHGGVVARATSLVLPFSTSPCDDRLITSLPRRRLRSMSRQLCAGLRTRV